MSRFDPVALPPERQLNGKVSQTFLRHYNGCPRSGYLYALYKGEASTPEMQRGSALHAAIERGTQEMISRGEGHIPPDLFKAFVDATLADPEYAVPIEEHDYLREAAYRWASEFLVDPKAVPIAVETLFVLELDEWQVRARIDYAELLENGTVANVLDYKSGRGLPSYEDVSRKRDDGSMATKNFQLVLYALVLAFGRPVRIEECDRCHGDGMIGDGYTELNAAGEKRVPCVECGGTDDTAGHGYVEIVEPFPLAGRVQRFELSFVYPGVEEKSTGKMARRSTSLTRLEVEEYKVSLEALLSRLRHSEQTGDWPAVASDDACGECPAKPLCPIPPELRDHRGTINTFEQASEAAEKLYREKAEHKARQEELRRFAKAHGRGIRFGNGMVWDFGFQESERIADKEAMWQAVDRAVRYGDPFDPSQHMKRSTSTPFAVRKLTADELTESEGS